MARSTHGRNIFVATLALLALACMVPPPLAAEDQPDSSPPFFGPEIPVLSAADSLAQSIDVPERLRAASADLNRSQRLWKAGRVVEAQIAAERLLSSMHQLRSQLPVSYAQNSQIISLIQQAGGMRLKCVRQHLALRPAFNPAPAEGDSTDSADGAESPDIADLPLSEAAMPSDSLMASPTAQDIQPENNDRVQKWIDFFTGRGRKTFAAWLNRSGKYMDMMVPVLQRNGMPPDLIHLVFVESGFNPTALSTSAASGPWQFVSGTARIFRLNVDGKFDERRDPKRSTEAAAQYLKHLYSLFHDWPLALAAYNSGEGTVLRALKSQNTFDYWSLKLPRQTEDYVPEFMAALTIARDPAAYGFDGKVSAPLAFDEIVVPGGSNLRVISYLTSASIDELKKLNPAILRRQAPRQNGGVVVRVPRGSGAQCLARLKTQDYPAALAAPEREPRRASARASHGRAGHHSRHAAHSKAKGKHAHGAAGHGKAAAHAKSHAAAGHSKTHAKSAGHSKSHAKSAVHAKSHAKSASASGSKSHHEGSTKGKGA